MRAWFVCLFLLAGCLSVPVRPLDPNEARRLVAEEAWETHMVARRYVTAAQIAFEAKLHPRFTGIAFERARALAAGEVAFFEGTQAADTETQHRAWSAYWDEAAIACRYGPARATGELAVRDIEVASETLGYDDLRYLLLEHACPMSPADRLDIVMLAVSEHRDAYALELMSAFRWPAPQMTKYLAAYLASGDCSFAFKAAARLRISIDDGKGMAAAASCEDETFNTKGWDFSQSDFYQLFFAAVRQGNYHLALVFNRLACGGEHGVQYVAQHILAHHQEYGLNALYERHPALRTALYRQALEAGRARFVGMHAKSPFWQARAHARLLEDEKFEDAAEVAEYGVSEAFRTEGILAAFRAALATGHLLEARYLWKRYPDIIPAREYLRAEAAWMRAHPEDRHFGRARRLPRKKPRAECRSSEQNDWTVTRCD